MKIFNCSEDKGRTWITDHLKKYDIQQQTTLRVCLTDSSDCVGPILRPSRNTRHRHPLLSLCSFSSRNKTRWGGRREMKKSRPFFEFVGWIHRIRWCRCWGHPATQDNRHGNNILPHSKENHARRRKKTQEKKWIKELKQRKEKEDLERQNAWNRSRTSHREETEIYPNQSIIAIGRKKKKEKQKQNQNSQKDRKPFIPNEETQWKRSTNCPSLWFIMSMLSPRSFSPFLSKGRIEPCDEINQGSCKMFQ